MAWTTGPRLSSTTATESGYSPWVVPSAVQPLSEVSTGSMVSSLAVTPPSLTLLDRGLVHPDDADAWRATFIDVEGGGRGQYILSAADCTWRTLVITVPCTTPDSDSSSDDSSDSSDSGDSDNGSDSSSSDSGDADSDTPDEPRQLQHASFGTHVVQHSFETEFARQWAEKLTSPRAWLPLLIADVWRDSQLELLQQPKHPKRHGFRDIDPETGLFVPLPGRGRPSASAAPPAHQRNALDGSNYLRNLYSLLLQQDVSADTFQQWSDSTQQPPLVTVDQLKPWLKQTGAQVTIWEHRGKGLRRIGAADADKSKLRPTTLHLGVRGGCGYRLLLEGPWQLRFGSTTDSVDAATEFAVDHGIPTTKCYRHMAATVLDDKDNAQTDGVPAVRVFETVSAVAEALIEVQECRSESEQTRSCKKKAGPFEQWFYASSDGLRYLATQLHFRGITCEARLSSFSSWTMLKFPGLGVSIRTWCQASMGGLHPEDITAEQASQLTQCFNEHFTRLSASVLNFRVASQYSPSLQRLLECFCRGPIVGAENSEGTAYDAFDMQCDINAAHPAAMLQELRTVPCFGYFDDVQVCDGHAIEPHSLYLVELTLSSDGSPQALDAFLNADVTLVTGRNYLKYLEQADQAGSRPVVPHKITHYVRPSRIVHNCHIPTAVSDLLASELTTDSDSVLSNQKVTAKVKKGVLVTLSGMLQQRYSDHINAVIVSGAAEAQQVGGKQTQVSAEMEATVAQLRAGGKVTQPILSQDAHVCMQWKRY